MNTETDYFTMPKPFPIHIAPMVPFEHDRYKIMQKIPKRGAWGTNYLVEDVVTEQIITAKDFDITPTAAAQLVERKLTLEDVIKKEDTQLRAPDKVVQAWIDVDKNGRLLLLKPAFEKDYEDVIAPNGSRHFLGEGISIEKLHEDCIDLATSLSGFHTVYDKAHCDFKPANILTGRLIKSEYSGPSYILLSDRSVRSQFSGLRVIYDGLWLSDSGTSTGSSVKDIDAARSNMGFIYTRAPENFRQNARPKKSSDVWSFGSLVYRLFTGKYVLEDELDNAVDPAKYINGLDDKVAKALINTKLKNVPKPYRKFLKKCLSFETYCRNARFEDGTEMKKAWEETVANLDPFHFYKSQIKKFIFPAMGIGIALTGIIYGSKLEPTKVDMPKSQLQGQAYMTESIPKEHLMFERDTIPEPKELINYGAMNLSSSSLRQYTQNMYVAHFLRAYDGAILERGSVNIDIYTDEQFKTYINYTSPDERSMAAHGPLAIVAKSLEVAMTKSKTPSGVVDLEDVFAIARMGEDKINMARRISGSFDYKIYSKAKDASGQYLISEKEQNFIMGCLSRVDLEK